MNKTINEQALFEAKLGILQQLDSPIAPMDLGIENFKHGITQEIFTKQRDEILNTNLKDVENVSIKYLSNDHKHIVGKSVIGQVNEELLTSGKKEEWVVSQQKE